MGYSFFTDSEARAHILNDMWAFIKWLFIMWLVICLPFWLAHKYVKFRLDTMEKARMAKLKLRKEKKDKEQLEEIKSNLKKQANQKTEKKVVKSKRKSL